jgi:hypothetical protein
MFVSQSPALVNRSRQNQASIVAKENAFIHRVLSHDQAAGHNVGQSNLLPLDASPPSIVWPLSGLPPFTVGIPEPSALVLGAFAGAALPRIRRRK